MTYTDNAEHLVIGQSGAVVGHADSYGAALALAKADVDFYFGELSPAYAFIVPVTKIERTA